MSGSGSKKSSADANAQEVSGEGGGSGLKRMLSFRKRRKSVSDAARPEVTEMVPPVPALPKSVQQKKPVAAAGNGNENVQTQKSNASAAEAPTEKPSGLKRSLSFGRRRKSIPAPAPTTERRKSISTPTPTTPPTDLVPHVPSLPPLPSTRRRNSTDPQQLSLDARRAAGAHPKHKRGFSPLHAERDFLLTLHPSIQAQDFAAARSAGVQSEAYDIRRFNRAVSSPVPPVPALPQWAIEWAAAVAAMAQEGGGGGGGASDGVPGFGFPGFGAFHPVAGYGYGPRASPNDAAPTVPPSAGGYYQQGASAPLTHIPAVSGQQPTAVSPTAPEQSGLFFTDPFQSNYLPTGPPPGGPHTYLSHLHGVHNSTPAPGSEAVSSGTFSNGDAKGKGKGKEKAVDGAGFPYFYPLQHLQAPYQHQHQHQQEQHTTRRKSFSLPRPRSPPHNVVPPDSNDNTPENNAGATPIGQAMSFDFPWEQTASTAPPQTQVPTQTPDPIPVPEHIQYRHREPHFQGPSPEHQVQIREDKPVDSALPSLAPSVRDSGVEEEKKPVVVVVDAGAAERFEEPIIPIPFGEAPVEGMQEGIDAYLNGTFPSNGEVGCEREGDDDEGMEQKRGRARVRGAKEEVRVIWEEEIF